MTANLRFIHVGVGGFGKNWLRCLKENPAVEVVAMVDINDKALDDACAATGYSKSICHSSLSAALKSTKADALISTTPPKFHKDDVITGLHAGLHVISEKPMADSIENCKQMLKAANETRKTYVISQNYRYSPVAWTMGQLARSGRLGDIGQARIDFFKGVDFGGGFRHEMAHPLVVDMSIHHFDLIRFITCLDAISVQGVTWNPKWSNYRGTASCALVFEMNNGARILYNGSWCSKGQFDEWMASWQIEGEKGTMVFRNNELRVYDVPKLYGVDKIEIIPPQAPPKQDQAYVLDDFLKCIESGARPATDVYDNIRSVAMVYAAVEAMQTGKNIHIFDDEIRMLIEGK